MRTYIYIACRSHSGSTLLEKLLATASGVFPLGEICHFSHYFDDPSKPCGCGAAVRDCPFWNQVVSALDLPKGVPVQRVLPTDGYRSAYWAENVSYFAALLYSRRTLRAMARLGHRVARVNDQAAIDHWQLIDAVSQVSGAHVLVDKSMPASRLLEIAQRAPDDVRICPVHLVRDGRANAYSHRAMFNTPVAVSSYMWRRVNTRIEHAIDRFPGGAAAMLRYEDLCADPRAALSGLAERFGLKLDFDIGRIDAPAHTVGGNHAKLTGYSEIALDQRWVEGLSRDETEVFRRVAGAINRRYGYDD